MTTGNEWLFALTLLAALGCGLMAGIFFTFSAFVMKALGRLPANEAIAAMQSINVAIVNPLFLVVFLGTALTSIFAVISAILSGQSADTVYLIAGAVLYLVGGIVVTTVFNIPKNDALAEVVPTDSSSANFWDNYLARWTRWNHVRTVTVLAAAVFFTIALGIGN